MSGHDQIEPARELSSEERALLEYMIGLVPSGRDELTQQAATARVSATCSCGCGTYDLVVDPAAPIAPEPSTPAADAVGSGDDHPLEVLLFAREGRLGCVEIVRYGDVDPGKPLPTPSELEQARWSDPDEAGTRRLLNPPEHPAAEQT